MGIASYFEVPDEEPDKSSLEDIFNEEPVPLDIFIRDKYYLNSPRLSHIQYDVLRHAEQILYPSTYELMAVDFDPYWSPVRMVNYLTCMWGKGGGKDMTCRVASLRIGYLLRCMKSPQTYFGMPELDSIHTLNVAASSGQAQQAFFTPMTRMVKRGWFADKCQPKNDRIVWDNYVEMISGHSDTETQEGLNLLLGIADELDAFKSKEEMVHLRAKRMREPVNSAEGIVELLHTSAKTRFEQTFKVMHISYPRFLGSPIMQRMKKGTDKQAQKSNSIYYTSGPHATWDANPTKRRDMFDEDYEDDPILARAKYECKPERAVDPYFRNELAVTSCLIASTPLTVSYEIEQGVISPIWVPSYDYAPDFKPIEGAQYAIHADLAISGDRAGVAMAHVKNWDEHEVVTADEEGSEVRQWVSRPNVKVDFAIAYEASKKTVPAREIQIRWVRQLIQDLRARGFIIAKVTYDGFQSADSMQILESWGIETDRVSTDRDTSIWQNLRDLFSEGRITIPFNQILLDEILSLMRMPNGKIDHPIAGSKDIADAVACAAYDAVELGGQEDEEGTVAYPSEFSFENFKLNSALTPDIPFMDYESAFTPIHYR